MRLGKYDFEVPYDDSTVHYLRKIAAGKVPQNEIYQWISRHAKETNKEPSPEIQAFISLLEKVV